MNDTFDRKQNNGSVPSDPGKSESGRNAAQGAHAKNCCTPSRRSLFFPALGFLFPLAYLFFDLFAFLGAAMGEGGASRFALLATDPSFATNSAGELLCVVFGTENPVLLLSLKDLSMAEFRLPLTVTLICSALCVFAGACLLLFGRKAVCSRLLSDLTVGAGLFGAFAPFVGKLAYLLETYAKGGFAAMERASAELILSVEALLITLVCCAFLLASVASIRRLSARARGAVVYTPLLCDRAGVSFPLAKILTAVFLLLCLGIGCLFFIGNVYLPDYHLSDWKAEDLLTGAGELLRGLISGEGEETVLLQVLTLLADVFFALQLPVLAIGVVVLIIRILIVLLTPRALPKRGKKLRNEGKKTAEAGRGLLLTPFWYCLSYQILATCLLISAMGGHLDFAMPEQAMTLLYLAVAATRSLLRAGGAYAVLVSVGAVLWHLAAGLHNTMTLRRMDAAGKGEV